MSPGRFNSSQRLDRGRRQGAQWWYVTPTPEMINYAQHKAHGGQKHADWILFRSGKEAKRWIGLSILATDGQIRNLRRQVPYPLLVVRPDGLPTKIATYYADFVFESEGRFLDGAQPLDVPRWRTVVEDVKPSGGLREDVYLLKRKHVEAQYGITIEES